MRRKPKGIISIAPHLGNNGCICCSINGELVEAIEKLINLNKNLDYIIIETTGLADPLPVVLPSLRLQLVTSD